MTLVMVMICAMAAAVQLAGFAVNTHLLVSPKAEVRVAVLRDLASHYPPNAPWESIASALYDSDKQVQIAAIRVFKAATPYHALDASYPDLIARVCAKLATYASASDPELALSAASTLAEQAYINECTGTNPASFEAHAQRYLKELANTRPGLLIKLLDDPSNKVFDHVCRELAHPRSLELEPSLVPFTRSSDIERRASAIGWLHRIDPDRARPMVLQLMEIDDKNEVAKESAWRIAGHDPWFVNSLAPRYHELSFNVRYCLLKSLNEEILDWQRPILLSGLIDEDGDLRRSAWSRAEFIATREMRYAALSDPHRGVRTEAAIQLCREGDESDLPTLERLYDRDGYRYARFTEIAKKMGQRAETLARRLLRHRDPNARRCGLDVIRELNLSNLYPSYERMIQDPNEEVRSGLIDGSGDLPQAMEERILRSLARDRSASVRRMVAICVSRLYEKALPILELLVEDSDWDVRQTAADSLSELRAELGG